MKRHDLVWLDKEYCKKNDFLVDSFGDKKTIMEWIEKNHPFIVTMQPNTNKMSKQLGFLLPLDEGKKRISITVKKQAIYAHTSPVKLSQILLKVEKRWQIPLTELVDSFSSLELELSIFGSSMWEYVIDKRYMTENSDIDLLWKPLSFYQLEKGLTILKNWMEKYSLKIDGEVEFLCGSSCSWKELLNEDDNIIIKRVNGVSLESKNEFINSLKAS